MNRNNEKIQILKEISILLEGLDKNEISNFLLEILTDSELIDLSKRWRILTLLSKGKTQREIAGELNVSLCKITRGAKILKNKNGISAKYLKGEKNE